jgi:hypothetical protein
MQTSWLLSPISARLIRVKLEKMTESDSDGIMDSAVDLTGNLAVPGAHDQVITVG